MKTKGENKLKGNRIILPLDVGDIDEALRLAKELESEVAMFKVGLEFMNAMFASLFAKDVTFVQAHANLDKLIELFEVLNRTGIFWDGKFDDIPNTVGGATAEISKLDVSIINVHASAGPEAIRRAVENKGNAEVFVVTVLTSLSEGDCISIFGDIPDEKVLQFAEEALSLGVDGIICSAKDVEFLNEVGGFESLKKITPGVRPKWAPKNDQSRVKTPREAVEIGIDYIVVGRPITKPPEGIGSSVDAARKIQEEIKEAENEM